MRLKDVRHFQVGDAMYRRSQKIKLKPETQFVIEAAARYYTTGEYDFKWLQWEEDPAKVFVSLETTPKAVEPNQDSIEGSTMPKDENATPVIARQQTNIENGTPVIAREPPSNEVETPVIQRAILDADILGAPDLS